MVSPAKIGTPDRSLKSNIFYDKLIKKEDKIWKKLSHFETIKWSITKDLQLSFNKIAIDISFWPCCTLVTVGDGRVDALVGVLRRLEDEAEGSVVGIDKSLNALAVGDELLLVEQPLDVGHRVSGHLTLELDRRAFDGLGRSKWAIMEIEQLNAPEAGGISDLSHTSMWSVKIAKCL